MLKTHAKIANYISKKYPQESKIVMNLTVIFLFTADHRFCQLISSYLNKVAWATHLKINFKPH
jgi:hypothetical protein